MAAIQTSIPSLNPLFQISPQHGFERLAVVRNAEVEQFFHDDALAEVGVLVEEKPASKLTPLLA